MPAAGESEFGNDIDSNAAKGIQGTDRKPLVTESAKLPLRVANMLVEGGFDLENAGAGEEWIQYTASFLMQGKVGLHEYRVWRAEAFVEAYFFGVWMQSAVDSLILGDVAQMELVRTDSQGVRV